MDSMARLSPISATQVLTGLDKTARYAFAATVVFALITPSWRYGPFSWFPILKFENLAGGPAAIGLLNLLPVIVLVTWLGRRLIQGVWRESSSSTWQWGRLGFTLPLLGISLLGLFSLNAGSARLQFIHVGGLVLTWMVYLFSVNERPRLFLPLLIVAAVQGSVAIGQFLMQSDLGLTLLGELPLNPIYEGVSVLWARDQAWLRAYGLAAHPNLLGAILAVALLFMLPRLGKGGVVARFAILTVFIIALVGLESSFSRAAGLAFLTGLLTWALTTIWRRPSRRLMNLLPSKSNRVMLVIPVLSTLVFLLFFGDLWLSRLAQLDSQTEATSINQRISDSELAVEIIDDNEWSGVGLGNYTDVATNLNPTATRVHNVPLLVTAELGLLGLFLLTWLVVSGLRSGPEGLILWMAVLVIGAFDTTLWLTSNWQTAILFGLVAAKVSGNSAKRSRSFAWKVFNRS